MEKMNFSNFFKAVGELYMVELLHNTYSIENHKEIPLNYRDLELVLVTTLEMTVKMLRL